MCGLSVEYHYSDSYKYYVCRRSAGNAASPVPETTADSVQKTMVVVTTNKGYYVSRVEFLKPVQETSQSAGAELVLST